MRMNEINYVKHTLYTPETYHRRFDLDVPEETNIESGQESGWGSYATRIALAALPYISLYRPIGSTLSIGMGSCRTISHLSAAVAAGQNSEWKSTSFELFQTTLAVFSVANTLFNFTLGLAISTMLESVQGFANLGHALYLGEYRRAVEEALQTLSSALYLGFMATGTLEIMVGFALVQAVTSLLQAQGNIAHGRYLEAASNIGMGCIRLHQANGYLQQIESRKRFLAIQKYADFLRRALKGREVRHLLENPLSEFKDAEHAVLDGIDFGAYFSGYGKDLVKGANLAFRTKIIDGKEITELEFKVNHVFRKNIEDMIDSFSTLNPDEMNEMLRMAHSHAYDVQIEKNSTTIRTPIDGWPITNTRIETKITLGGLGSILIGSSPDFPTTHNRVIVQMEKGKNIYDLHELMAFLDVDRALHQSTKEDMDRLKMGHLFRIFSPREATPFERSKEFFDLPLDELKRKMIEKAPKMEKIFDESFDAMTPGEILPGKIRYRVNGLAKAAYEHGVRGLTASITGATSLEGLYSRIAGILKMGMLSTELRERGNLESNGFSNQWQYILGSSDSVFTQMISEKNCREQLPFYEMGYDSAVHVLISLDALETGTYQYFGNAYGMRRAEDPWYWGIERESYPYRYGILDYIETINLDIYAYGTNIFRRNPYLKNEVMLKERVDPSFFTGIAVNNETTRDGLMNYLRSQEIVQKDSAGQETILGVAADRFIRVANTFSEDLFV